MTLLSSHKEAIASRFGRTANTESVAYKKGYEEGSILSRNGAGISEFPINWILAKTSSYAWGYYDGFVNN